MPEALRREDGLEAALRRAEAAVQDGRRRHEAAVAAERDAGAALQKARHDLEHGQAVHASLVGELEQHRTRFEAALAAAGLDAAAFAAARADIPRVEEWTARLQAHEQACAGARDRLGRAQLAVEGAERPDLELQGLALREADAALTTAEAAVAAAALVRDQLNVTLQAITEQAQAQAAAEARYAVLGGLADLTDGKNAARVRLRDFAIAATFEAVLEAANQRFARMSRGRFTLLRKSEGGDGRSRGGLDVEVHDAHTDQRRDAYTLSGGEGFLASLSLALGLSDVVQAETGGIKLDAIFIDEGFGHLDDETLEVALETLRDLVGRDRAVGVISHVEAVKQQIPAGFDVVRQGSGSAVRPRAG